VKEFEVVDLIKVDPVGPEAAQRCLARLDQVPPGKPRVVPALAHPEKGLGRHSHCIAPRPQRSAQNFLGTAAGVGIGGVEEIGAMLQADIDEPFCHWPHWSSPPAANWPTPSEKVMQPKPNTGSCKPLRPRKRYSMKSLRLGAGGKAAHAINLHQLNGEGLIQAKAGNAAIERDIERTLGRIERGDRLGDLQAARQDFSGGPLR